MTILLYRTSDGPVFTVDGQAHALPATTDWDELLNLDDLPGHLRRQARGAVPARPPDATTRLLRPLVSQEVWAAGVTYFRSRTARMEESKDAGGGTFYDRVYSAERPELFFKASPHRVADPGGVMRLRRDSSWLVPEPELALFVNRRNQLAGYTIGNDLSCRDIEGENPLYLPQAKVWDGSAALGPGLLVQETPLPRETRIALEIRRDGARVAGGETTLAQLKRSAQELIGYLTRECSFPHGVFLLTGTGIVPPDDFSLRAGDAIHIRIDPIGELVNRVA